jgi:hypothetical protein
MVGVGALYSCQRRWTEGGAVTNRGQGNGGGEVMGTVRQRQPLSEDGQCSLGAVWSMRLTARAHVIFYYPQIIQTGSNLKIKMDTLTCTKNSQILQVSSLGYWEHFSQLF